MFGNILYFIIVLLVYATYQPSETADFSAGEAVTALILMTVLFTVLVKAVFARLEKQIATEGSGGQDQRLESIIARQSILAIMLFGIDYTGWNCPGLPAS